MAETDFAEGAMRRSCLFGDQEYYTYICSLVILWTGRLRCLDSASRIAFYENEPANATLAIAGIPIVSSSRRINAVPKEVVLPLSQTSKGLKWQQTDFGCCR